MNEETQPLLELECWKCGVSLKDVPRPLTRHSLCPVCRIDLHVCRLCRHYAPKYTGQCAHDHADHVTDKEKANFCDYFKPRRGAYHEAEDSMTTAAKSALDDLFDSVDAQNTQQAKRRERVTEQTDQARKQLDDLFGDDVQNDSNE